MASAQAAAKNIVEAVLNAARAQLAETSEDSFATRCDLHRRSQDLTWALRMVMRPVDDTINLGKVLVDYGHDPEAAASDHACGIEHVSEADRARAQHATLINRLAPAIDTLRHAGFSVLTDLTFVAAPEHDDEASA